MLASLSVGIWLYLAASRRVTTALYSFESNAMLVTRPTSTPDMDTGAPTLRSPILSNFAVTS